MSINKMFGRAKLNILSPMATGNGAYVIHRYLKQSIQGYQLLPYHPYRTLFPALLFSIGRNKNTNLIHTTPDYAAFHAKRNVPLVLTFHNYVLDRFMRDYSNCLQNIHYQTDLKWLTKKAVNLANEITAVSQFTANLVQQELRLYKKVRVIYNGIDETLFTPVKKLAAQRQIKVLFSGNLSRRKGAQWLLPILKKLNPNISIYYTSGLRNVKELSVHPRLINIGRIDYADMPALYQSADMLLFPTVREGFGLAAAEAMACGLPVVATNCSALPELIDNGKGGFLSGLGEIDDFAEKINLLAENSNLRKEMGEYNREKVERMFTLNRMVHEYQSLFDNFCTR
jgi:glycosyltransferase involved in cell wall biosynthesis